MTLLRTPAALAVLLVMVLVTSVGRAQPGDARCPAPAEGTERPWLDPSYTPQCRAALVLATLPTLEDRLALIEGSGFGTPPALAALGLETGRTQDGPAGFDGGTAWPTPLTLAASFDPELAARFGVALGREFRESGRNGILGPAMDMTRTWRFGRSTESFGEDPVLASRIVAREVAGIQSEHVLATIKHFAVYTQEQGRLGDSPTGERPAVNQIVGERAIREIYLPTFEAAVVAGGAGGVMCSFPRINGTYACEHGDLLTGILKTEWRFDGAVFPDFPVAQRRIVAAFAAGLDSGVTSPAAQGGGSASAGRFAGAMSLREAVATGVLPESRIDDLVLRRLVPGFRIGTFDHPATASHEDPSTPEARALAAQMIQAGAVLLKNDGALPLAEATRQIAVIGTQAGDDPVVVEQGSAFVEPRHLVTAMEGLRARAPAATALVYAAGDHGLGGLPALPPGLLRTPDGAPGLRAEYYASPDIRLPGESFAARIEPGIDVNGAPDVAGLPADKAWAVRWSGSFTAVASGVHELRLEGSGSAELWIDGVLQDAFYNADFGAWAYGAIRAEAGQRVAIEIRYSPRATLGDAERNQFSTILGTVLRLGYVAPDARFADAVRAAAAADVALVFVGHRVGEGMDRRSLSLPARQDELIAAVAAANPRAIVVLATGGPVTMPWLDAVAGVLQIWLPGDAYGTAVAGLLYGDADPGGRLPVTFPADETQGPGVTAATYPGRTGADGSLDTVSFEEGLAIGYRYWDAHGQAPLFPFGYGLSYARFGVELLGARARRGGGAEVRARVTNTSDRVGTQVLQVYLGFPEAEGEPPRQLEAFAKVTLDPGERRDVTIPLDTRAFQIWDAESDRWTTPAGSFEVMLGLSSRDIVGRRQLAPRVR
jgi:beta-glucosidase